MIGCSGLFRKFANLPDTNAEDPSRKRGYAEAVANCIRKNKQDVSVHININEARSDLVQGSIIFPARFKKFEHTLIFSPPATL